MDFLMTLQEIRSPFLTVIFRFFTLFGEETVAVVLLCLLYWCVDKELAFNVAIAFFVSALLVQGLKIALRIDRPWILDPALLPVPEAVATATGFSFPSGHTQTATSLFGMLALQLSGRRKGLSAACWVMVALVGFSRLYLGVHTPLDVVAGFAVTMSVCLGVTLYTRSGRPDAPLLGLLGLLSVAVIVYAAVLHGQGHIDRAYLSDCVKAAGGCIGCAIGFLWARRAIPFPTETPRLWQQLAKLAVGLAGVFLCKSGLKLLLGPSLPVDALRYILLAVWALALFPLLIHRVLGKRETA